MKLLLGFLALIVVIAICSQENTKPVTSSRQKRSGQQTTKTTKPEFTSAELSEIREFEKTAIKMDFIKRVDAISHIVYVDAAIWEVADVNGKETLLLMCGKYCAWKDGPELTTRNVELRDFQSGRKLGTWSVWSGAKFF